MQQFCRQERGEGTFCRQDKILAAKMAFGAGGHRNSPRAAAFEPPEKEMGDRKHRYGLWRFLVTVMLFLTFLAGRHFDVSLPGWNQESLEKMLSDDTRWRQVVRQVSRVMDQMPGGDKTAP